jgi:hypothetical protein
LEELTPPLKIALAGFLDRRIADLELQLLDPAAPQAGGPTNEQDRQT